MEEYHIQGLFARMLQADIDRKIQNDFAGQLLLSASHLTRILVMTTVS